MEIHNLIKLKSTNYLLSLFYINLAVGIDPQIQQPPIFQLNQIIQQQNLLQKAIFACSNISIRILYK